MATSTNHRTPDQVRHEIQSERDQLAGAVDHLRDEIREATDIGAKVRGKLPVITAGALTAGFVAVVSDPAGPLSRFEPLPSPSKPAPVASW